MKLTDRYLLEKPADRQGTRFDCISSTGGYEPLEKFVNRPRAKTKWLFLYYMSMPEQFSVNAHRNADRVITTPDGKNLSSVYFPNSNTPLLGYGDVVGTNDALLYRFSEDYNTLEIFVARGMKRYAKGLFALFADGELSGDIETLRSQSTLTGAL